MKDLSGKMVVVLVGSIISLLVILATMGATFATPEGVSKQIVLESPYVKDRSLILYRLKQIEGKQDEILKHFRASKRFVPALE